MPWQRFHPEFGFSKKSIKIHYVYCIPFSIESLFFFPPLFISESAFHTQMRKFHPGSWLFHIAQNNNNRWAHRRSSPKTSPYLKTLSVYVYQVAADTKIGLILYNRYHNNIQLATECRVPMQKWCFGIAAAMKCQPQTTQLQ